LMGISGICVCSGARLAVHAQSAYMFAMNWGAFDLNLLIVFDAVMQDRSVTRAGNRIGLSQPAMSHALNRLRHMLKDELFVRTPEGMVPTPRAEQLAVPVREALDGLQHSLEPPQFDPANSTKIGRASCRERVWSEV